MNECINRNSIYNKLANFFNDCITGGGHGLPWTRDEILSKVENEPTVDLGKELNAAQRDATNYLIKDLRLIIPVALWDKTAEKLTADQCSSLWQYCLECVREMKDAWEAENGENLVWVPGHYEEAKNE